MSNTNYEAMLVKDLRKLAVTQGITGTSKARKAELIVSLRETDEYNDRRKLANTKVKMPITLFVIGRLNENNTITNSFGFAPTKRGAFLEAQNYMCDSDLDKVESYMIGESEVGEIYLFEITEALALLNLKVGNNGMMFKNLNDSNIFDVR